MSLFSFFFLLCFCFMKRTTSKYSITSFCSSILSHFCWFPLFFFLSNSLSLSLFFFLILSFVFCSTSVFFFEKCKFKNTHFFQKKGVQHNVFLFLSTCVLQNVKSYRFLGGFLHFLGSFSKNTIKIGILAHFSKQQITKKWHFWKLLSGPSWKLLSGPSWVSLKKRQLGPDNNFQNFSAQFCFSKKRAETPIFIVFFFDNWCFIKKKQTWTRQ